jgi:hypothetical protein
VRLQTVHGDHLLAVANLEDECLQPRPDYPVRPCISRGQVRPGTALLDVDVGRSLQVSRRRLRGYLCIGARLADGRWVGRGRLIPESEGWRLWARGKFPR